MHTLPNGRHTLTNSKIARARNFLPKSGHEWSLTRSDLDLLLCFIECVCKLFEGHATEADVITEPDELRFHKAE
jgi:hypothetical protein